MHSGLAKVLLLVAMAVLFAGCRSNPVYDVDQAEVVTSGKGASQEQVRKAIVRAGARLGWVMKDAGNNHLLGTLRLRKHVAIVDVTYGAKSYSIKYKDSTNLNYENGNINPRYNSWIQNLQRYINAELGTF